MEEQIDRRFRSRKWLLAAFAEGFASVIALLLVIVNLICTGDPMPALWWWASVTGGVLSLYGTTKALDTMARGGKP